MICVDCRHLDSYALCQLLRKGKCLICVSILYQCLDRGKLIFIIVHFSSLTLIDFFPVLIICNTIFLILFRKYRNFYSLFSFIQHIFPLHLCISCLGNRNLFSRGKCHHISADLCNVPHIYKKT